MVFILSYVLAGAYGIVLFPFLFKRYRLDPDTDEIRSISAMICQFRPLGHFVMSLGNLMLFEIMTLEYKSVAWAYWVALQLVLSFDIDEYKFWHFLFLLVYIAMLLLFWGQVCQDHGMWVQASGLWVTTGLFSLTWLANMLIVQYKLTYRPRRQYMSGLLKPLEPEDPERWKYHSLQSTFEILWVMAVIATTGVYEYDLKVNHNISSDAYY